MSNLGRPSVFEMVRQVIADSQEQFEKSAAEENSNGAVDADKAKKDEEDEDEDEDKEKKEASHLKVAEQCEFVSENFHLVDDQRSPAEKLAEHVAIQEALAKMAEDPPMDPPMDSGVGPGGSQSAMKAEPSTVQGDNSAEAGQMGEAMNQGPQNPAPAEKPVPASAPNAMPTNKDMMLPEQPEEVLKQSSDEQAQAVLQLFASRGYIEPEKVAAFKSEEQKAKFMQNAAKVVAAQDPNKPGAETPFKKQAAPVEGATVKPNRWDAQEGVDRALSYKNEGIGQFIDAPDVISQRLARSGIGAGLGALGGAGLAALVKGRAAAPVGAALGAILGYAGGRTSADVHSLRKRGIEPALFGSPRFTPEAAEAYGVKQASLYGIPPRFAKVLLKQAADSENPAAISASTTPILQSAPGVPSTQMQGSEVGELTPRQTAPTSGQGDGRQFVSSIEAAMNYTKGQAKAPQKKALGEVLTEPALSSAHDNVLQKSLGNTSQAGVKISSASAAREMLKAASASSPDARKQLDEMIKAAIAGEAIPAPGAALSGAAEALAIPPTVSDEALVAASEGVTTDELATAQQQLAAQAVQATAAAANAGGAPTEAAPVATGAAPAQV